MRVVLFFKEKENTKKKITSLNIESELLCLSIDVSWDHFDVAIVAGVVDSVLVSSSGDDDLLSLASSALDNELNVVVSGGSIVPSTDN